MARRLSAYCLIDEGEGCSNYYPLSLSLAQQVVRSVQCLPIRYIDVHQRGNVHPSRAWTVDKQLHVVNGGVRQD